MREIWQWKSTAQFNNTNNKRGNRGNKGGKYYNKGGVDDNLKGDNRLLSTQTSLFLQKYILVINL